MDDKWEWKDSKGETSSAVGDLSISDGILYIKGRGSWMAVKDWTYVLEVTE
jgi:hypothetical protein